MKEKTIIILGILLYLAIAPTETSFQKAIVILIVVSGFTWLFLANVKKPSWMIHGPLGRDPLTRFFIEKIRKQREEDEKPAPPKYEVIDGKKYYYE